MPGKDKVVKLTETLACQITREEKEQAASSCANAIAERDALKDQFKAVSDQFKADISSREADISKFAGLVRNGVEWRSVPCERTRDYSAGEVVVRRTDTWEVVSRRPMSAGERQQEIGDIEEVLEDAVAFVAGSGSEIENGANGKKHRNAKAQKPA